MIQSQTSNVIGIYEMKSHEPCIFASIRSMDTLNKEISTDLNGKANLNIFGKEELLIVNNIGYKSLIISADALIKNDSIFLEQRQDGSEAQHPVSVIEIRIPSGHSDCKASIDLNATQKKQDLSVLRNRKVEAFISGLTEVCKGVQCHYRTEFQFQVDKNGNLRNFELVSYEYTPRPRIMDQVEKLGAIAEYILQDPTCFGPAIKKGHEELEEGIKEYKFSLKSKQ